MPVSQNCCGCCSSEGCRLPWNLRFERSESAWTTEAGNSRLGPCFNLGRGPVDSLRNCYLSVFKYSLNSAFLSALQYVCVCYPWPHYFVMWLIHVVWNLFPSIPKGKFGERSVSLCLIAGGCFVWDILPYCHPLWKGWPELPCLRSKYYLPPKYLHFTW